MPAGVINVHSPTSPKPDLAKVRTHEAVHGPSGWRERQSATRLPGRLKVSERVISDTVSTRCPGLKPAHARPLRPLNTDRLADPALVLVLLLVAQFLLLDLAGRSLGQFRDLSVTRAPVANQTLLGEVQDFLLGGWRPRMLGRAAPGLGSR